MKNVETISLCMIVRNEEENVGKCLESIKDIVDEIIIVDTGSTDKTMEICKTYEAKIYEYKWKENFSDARNFSLKQASSSWILYLDADEALDIHRKHELQTYIQKNQGYFYTFPIINYVGNSKTEESYTLNQIRLIKNGCNIKFEGAIHENLNIKNIIEKEGMVHIPCPIYHYGYLQTIVKNKEKQKRNMGILRKEYSSNPSDPWILYHLANEYYQQQQFETSIEYITQASLQFILQQRIPPSLLYKLKYDILWLTGQFEKLIEDISFAILLYPDYVDLYFYRGMALYKQERYIEALQFFEKCLLLGENNTKHLIERGVGTYKATLYQKKCKRKINTIK